MDVVPSPEIENNISQLEKIVHTFDTSIPQSSNRSFSFNIKYIYGLVPVVIFIILCIWSPRIVKSTLNPAEEITDSEPVYVLSYSKVLLWTIVIGGLIDGAIYVFLRRK